MNVNSRFLELIENLANGNKSKFANSIGVAPTVISNIVNAPYSEPSFGLLMKIITAYPKVSSEWLIKGEGEMFGNGNVSQSIENSGNNNKLGVVDIANNYGKRENELALENAKLRGQLEEKEAMINKILKMFGK